MDTWEQVSEGCYSYADGVWTLYLKIDDGGAMLEVYKGTARATVNNWGPAVIQSDDGLSWCKKQSLKILEQEKKKRI